MAYNLPLTLSVHEMNQEVVTKGKWATNIGNFQGTLNAWKYPITWIYQIAF